MTQVNSSLCQRYDEVKARIVPGICMQGVQKHGSRDKMESTGFARIPQVL